MKKLGDSPGRIAGLVHRGGISFEDVACRPVLLSEELHPE